MSVENQWLFNVEDLENVPSVKSGAMNQVQEIAARREGIGYILNIGQALKLVHNPTMATACVFFHRFYMTYSFDDFARGPAALACLFLAGKVEETPKKCKDIVSVAKDQYPQVFQTQKLMDEVISLEKVLLQTLRFDLHVEHPYSFLLKYAKDFKEEKEKMQKVVQTAWTLVNDSLYTTLCLLWEPEIIAISLLYMAFKLARQNNEWNVKSFSEPWWDSYVANLTVPMMEDICHKILDSYNGPKNEADSTGTIEKSTSTLKLT